MPELSKYKPLVRLIICLVGIFGIVFALARPWGGVKNQESSKEGIEIVIAVDASNSMLASATAEENGPERMRMAKLVLEKLINRLGNDKVGLIVYAGEAYTLIPVTNDYVSAKAFLNSIDPSLIAVQGTNIGSAIDLAKQSFSERKDVGKAIVLLTDAEELENTTGVLAEVQAASKQGIQTDVIGIGAAPVTIPDGTRGRMINEETGEVVRTALDEDLAIEIAKAGKGIYVNASNSDAIDELMTQLGNLKKAAMESSFYVSHDELYFPFVILALVMLIADFILTDKKNRLLDKITFFSKDRTAIWITVVITLSAFSTSCNKEESISVQNNEESESTIISQERSANLDSLSRIYSTKNEYDYIIKGNEFHNIGNFEKADSNYYAALEENKNSIVASLNTGINVIRKLMMESAEQNNNINDSIATGLLNGVKNSLLNAAAPKIEKGNVSSMAFYNIGNIDFLQENYSEAIDNYKEALRLNPSDDHARRNLRIAQLQKKNNQNQNQQQNQQDQQQDNRQNQQQNQQPENQERDQINEKTSEQILQAAERKENLRRMQMQQENNGNPSMRNRPTKNW